MLIHALISEDIGQESSFFLLMVLLVHKAGGELVLNMFQKTYIWKVNKDSQVNFCSQVLQLLS